ncbi:MAG: MFS transporter [Nibricoccus sp.]
MIITCKKKIPTRWIVFAVMPWAAFAFNDNLLAAAFVFSLKKFIENPAAIGFILALPLYLAIIIAPLSSFLSDRIWTRFGRRKPFVAAAGTCMVLALVAMPLAPNFWTLVGAYILYYIGDGLNAPRDPLQQEIVPPNERGRATGAMTWYQNFASVVFYVSLFGRFDEVRYFVGFPLHGETVMYWSAALFLAVMLMLIVLGIKEVDQKSSLRGQRLSLRNFFGGLLDRELWPVYLLVITYYLLNIYVSFGPYLGALLYTDQWNYTKQEMGNNVAIGGGLNFFIIGFLALVADRLPRMKAFRTLICLSLAWSAFYFCYVNFILPDKHPSLIEIIVFGEVVSVITILIGIIYPPLTYDYVKRNKMGTFAAGAQIAQRATRIFALYGISLFVTVYSSFFQPPAGEMTRIVLRDQIEKTAVVNTLRSKQWTLPQDASTTMPASALSAEAWQADGVVAKTGRAWELRLGNRFSAKLATERAELERLRSELVAEEKQLLETAFLAHSPEEKAKTAETARKKKLKSDELTTRIAAINTELARRAQTFQAQVSSLFSDKLVSEGDQVLSAQTKQAIVLDLSTRDRPEPKVIEQILDDLRGEFPALIDLRPLKRDAGYGLAASILLPSDVDEKTHATQLRTAIERVVAKRSPGLLDSGTNSLIYHRESAFLLELRVIEQPVISYVSPVTRAVNAVLALFDCAPSSTRRLSAIAHGLRVPEETNHVHLGLGRDSRTILVTALFQPNATHAAEINDPVGQKLTTLLGDSAKHAAILQYRAFYDRVERVSAAQRVTVVHPVLTADYMPMRYDYMSGYIWVLFVGLIGVSLTLVFGRLEARGAIRKCGIEEAKAS